MKHRIQVSAPGSLMIMGEHAVLYGARAVVAAVDKRIHAIFERRSDNWFVIESELGSVRFRLDRPPTAREFRFIVGTLRYFRPSDGMNIRIRSDFRHDVGLGSSAAVTVCCCAALLENPRPGAVFDAALSVVRRVQGMGSGADVAASVYGGVLLYRVSGQVFPRSVARLPLTVWYSGYKTPTADVVRRVQARARRAPDVFSAIYGVMDRVAGEAFAAIRKRNWVKLGRLFDVQHGLLAALGVSDVRLDQMAHALRDDPNIYGAKISGAGLGDCVIGLGHAQSAPPVGEALEVRVSSRGVCFDEA